MEPLDHQLILRWIAESGFISGAIRYVTNSEMSHCEVWTGSSFISAYLDGGVHEQPPNYTSPSWERWYAIPCTASQYKNAMDWAWSRIGTPYDKTDILGLLLHFDISSPNGIICSWFCFEYLMAAGIQPLNVLEEFANLVTPDALHLSPVLIGRSISPVVV